MVDLFLQVKGSLHWFPEQRGIPAVGDLISSCLCGHEHILTQTHMHTHNQNKNRSQKERNGRMKKRNKKLTDWGG